MKGWNDRPPEAAYLLNPAFCAFLIASAASTFEETAETALPYLTTFLILPVVLHKPTREALPHTARTSLPVWLTEHAEYRIGFGGRVRAMKPHTQEALLVGNHSGILRFDDAGIRSTSVKQSLTSSGARLSGEARECAGRARMVGGWFARAGDPATVFALWGVRP